MHSELSLALSREQASLGAARLLHVDEQLQACRKAIRHRLRLDLHLAPRAERHQSVRKARLFVRHRDKTLDSGASSGGALVALCTFKKCERPPRPGPALIDLEVTAPPGGSQARGGVEHLTLNTSPKAYSV